MAGAVEYETQRLRIAYELIDAACILSTGTPAYSKLYDARKEMEDLFGKTLQINNVRSGDEFYKIINSTKWGDSLSHDNQTIVELNNRAISKHNPYGYSSSRTNKNTTLSSGSVSGELFLSNKVVRKD